jgi:hypothetical protein
MFEKNDKKRQSERRYKTTAKEGDAVVVNSLRPEAYTDVEKLPIKG